MLVDINYEVLSSIFLCAQISVSIAAIWSLQKQDNINGVLKWIFYGNLLFTFITTVVWLGTSTDVFGDVSEDATWTLLALGFLLPSWNVTFILFTLIWRIIITFSGPSFELSKCSKLTLCTLTILSFVLPLPMSIHIAFDLDGAYTDWSMWSLMASFLVYPAMAIYAVYVFQSALLSLTKMQQSAELKERQNMLTELAARSFLLFFAACTSMTIFLFVAFNALFGDVDSSNFYIVIAIDQMINAFCLYLQFGFTKRVYMKCCKYPDQWCRGCVSRKIRKWQESQVMPAMVEVASPTNSSPSGAITLVIA